MQFQNQDKFVLLQPTLKGHMSDSTDPYVGNARNVHNSHNVRNIRKYHIIRNFHIIGSPRNSCTSA